MSDDGHERYKVQLSCSALDPEALEVLGMRGREAISELFEFEILVRTRDGVALVAEDHQEIMGGTATLSFGPSKEHAIHGVIREVTLLPAAEVSRAAYRMVLLPKLWDAGMTRGSWIHLDKDPKQIVTATLAEILPEGQRLAEGEDFELSLEGSYNPREYTVQYEESCLDFAVRHMERLGWFYFFEHGEEKAKVVVGNHNSKFGELEGFEELELRPVGGEGAVDLDEVVTEISATSRPVHAKVSLRDYNYRMPSVSLAVGPQDIDADGIGDVHAYGDHYYTPDEGSAMMAMRGELFLSRKQRMQARSRVRGLRAGHRFRLTAVMPRAQELLGTFGLARDYLVIAVEHRYEGGGGEGESEPYHNLLTLMPLEVAFRPELRTPKPKIHGFMHAKIDAESDGGMSVPCDEWGRYKVLMPFDVAGEEGGHASCWIRVATPMTGGSWGMSTQLHKGIEVAIYHVDGDPDRPVIANAVPNFETQAMVTSQNPNQNALHTKSGMKITFTEA